MKVPLRNRSGVSLGIRLEPWCDELELAPDEEAIIEFEINDELDTIEIDIEKENFVSLWLPLGATLKLRS